jgi:hypothetical protein
VPQDARCVSRCGLRLGFYLERSFDSHIEVLRKLRFEDWSASNAGSYCFHRPPC